MTQAIEKREENGTLMEGNNKWYLIGGIVIAGAVGYWLWQRSQKDDEPTEDGLVGPPEPPPPPPTPPGPVQVFPEGLPGIIPESAWNTTTEGTKKFSFVFGKTYVGSVVVPVWASPEHSSNTVIASGGIADLQVTSVTPTSPPADAPDHPAYSDWVRVSIKFRADGPGTVRLARWLESLNSYSEEIWGPGGVGPVVRTLLVEDPVAGE